MRIEKLPMAYFYKVDEHGEPFLHGGGEIFYAHWFLVVEPGWWRVL